MKKHPLIEPIVIVLFGVLVIVFSFRIEKVVESISIGPEFMPRLLGVFFVILGLALLPEALRKHKAARSEAEAEKNCVSEETSEVSPDGEKVLTKIEAFKAFLQKNMHWVIWLWALVYALVMNKLGFLFDSIIFLFGSMYLLTMREKKRNWWVIAIVSLVVPVFVYVIFRQKFYLMLPMGVCKHIPLLKRI